eukprot:1161882-Pelagomonas_calceolata.AAC.13
MSARGPSWLQGVLQVCKFSGMGARRTALLRLYYLKSMLPLKVQAICSATLSKVHAYAADVPLSDMLSNVAHVAFRLVYYLIIRTLLRASTGELYTGICSARFLKLFDSFAARNALLCKIRSLHGWSLANVA